MYSNITHADWKYMLAKQIEAQPKPTLNMYLYMCVCVFVCNPTQVRKVKLLQKY